MNNKKNKKNKYKRVDIRRRATAPAILRQVFKLIDSGRWLQGEYEEKDDNGVTCYCAVGAIQRCASSPIAAETAVMYLADVVGHRNGYSYSAAEHAVTEWNDEKTRTRKQVLSAIRKAEKLASKGE